MDQYKALVEDLFKKESPRVIANSSSAHAAVLYNAFFSHASDKICILCDKLDRTVFDDADVLRSAEQFLNNDNAKLYIGVTGEPDRDSRFFKLLSNKKQEKKEKKENIRVMPFPKLIADGKFVNFAVMDSRAYRYEPDSSRPCAIASAMDEPFASMLENTFFSNMPKPKDTQASEQKMSEGIK